MNRYLAAWGALLAVSGVTMYVLSQALAVETFFMAAYYIPPTQMVAVGLVVVGILLVVTSAFLEWPRYAAMTNEEAARYFVRAALFNTLAAAVFAFAMLIPPLEIPILFTEWPGIYIAISYGSFVGFGVMGMFAWGLMYQMLPSFFSRSLLDRRSVILQLVLSEVGIFVVSSILFSAGFIGATLVHDQTVGAVFIGASMEFADIPAATFIFVIIISVFLGAINIMGAKKTAAQP